MTISYKWLSEYLPTPVEPDKLSKILTSLGLEVESFEKFESVQGGLEGLIIGEVLTCEKHPNAEKLSITKVNVGQTEPLEIVCGAPNVAAGQKVIVAPVGTTIFPTKGDPLTMKVAKIRGVESHGMICAEDEIGLGSDHGGILVLAADARVGRPASEYFNLYSDWIYEIGLTPNRMDAMSHLGVAKDVCAYLSHHNKKEWKPKSVYQNNIRPDNTDQTFEIEIENKEGCQRYSGVLITNIQSGESPAWMQEKLRAIGVRPINNIVDITNYVLHETGQPLHAFDADEVTGKKIIVKNCAEGTTFISLDSKERKLSTEDLMICDGEGNPLCIAGVFGGLNSGVKPGTKNIFLESAWFNPTDIRKTSFRHNLRTDAAARFEKNVDISNTVNVLKRAAQLIREIAGGEISSDFIDVYPSPKEKTQVQLKFHYLRKLSGKNYHPDTVKKILTSLGFEVIKEGIDDTWVAVPYSKPDIALPADIVEEVMRVDGYDNIEIPQNISISPSIETDAVKHLFQEKVANYLTGLGFFEILTNSITNQAYYKESDLSNSVKMLNSLSAELNMLRPFMLETGLEVVAHNLNRKNSDLLLFEFGKTYSTSGSGKYDETEHLALYISGSTFQSGWKKGSRNADLFYAKGVISRIAMLTGMDQHSFEISEADKLQPAMNILYNKKVMGRFGMVDSATLSRFDIKQPVIYIDLLWQEILSNINGSQSRVAELPRQLPVHRDLAMVLEKSVPYGEVEKTIRGIGLKKLREVQLFDIFESEKLGKGKRSLAVSFTFLDEEKTLTDKEIDGMMTKIVQSLEKTVQAQIRNN